MPPKLKYLKVNQFRWVKPGCVLRFDEGMNFVLGRNGTGKTTLLDLIGAVWTGDFSAYAEEVLDVEFEFSLEFGQSLRCHVAIAAPDRWYIQATSCGPGRERHAVVDPKGLHPGSSYVRAPELLAESVRHAEGSVPNPTRINRGILNEFAPTVNWARLDRYFDVIGADEPEVWYHPDPNDNRVPSAGWLAESLNVRIDEATDWVVAAINGIEISARHGALTCYPVTLWTTAGADVPVVSRVWQAVTEANESPLDPSIETVADRASDGLLGNIVRALDVETISVRLDLESGEAIHRNRFQRNFRYHNPTIRITKKDGSTFSFDKLSHGQKRLFGLYWYLAASPQVLIADELANGLHYTMVEQILAGLGERQSFLAMQDPLLLYPVDFLDLEQVKRRFVICELSEEDKLEWWTWRQLRDDEAAEFWEAYQAGIEHVPDILRSRGLW